jgi:hypothetical protein
MEDLAPDNEEIRHLPVLASAPEARPIEPVRPMPLASPVVAAAGGLIAGFTTFLLVRILRRARDRRAPIRLGKRRRERIDIAASRSFLVDVHVLKR